VDIQYVLAEEQKQMQCLQQERQQVLHCEAMLQHAQQYVDGHIREQEERVWLRQLATEQLMYEALERERQIVAQALRHAEVQQESAERDRQMAQSTVHTALTELQQARDDAHLWQTNTRIQYQKRQQVSEEHLDLHQRQRLLEQENATLQALSGRQRADLQGLWKQEEHAAAVIRSFPPLQTDKVRLAQTLRAELKEAEQECVELQRLNRDLRNGLRQCDGDKLILEAHKKALLERSMKQSEEILQPRMDLNRRDKELRRSAEAAAHAEREREHREISCFVEPEQSSPTVPIITPHVRAEHRLLMIGVRSRTKVVQSLRRR
jgi:hypothetical protein